MHATYTSYVKGFNIVGQVKEINVSIKIISSHINFEVQQDHSQQPFVKTFHIDRLVHLGMDLAFSMFGGRFSGKKNSAVQIVVGS